MNRARVSFFGAVAALGLLATAAVAQTVVTAYGPYNPETGRVRAIQAIVDADLSANEIASVIGLLRDLQMAEQDLQTQATFAVNDLITDGSAKASADTRMAEANRVYKERHDRIWNLINERLGATKTAALHKAADNCLNQGPTTVAYTSERISRIDSLLSDWEKLRAGQEVQTTTTTTTTTTVVTPAPAGQAHVTYMGTAFVPISYGELVELLEARLVAMTGSPEAAMILRGYHSDIHSDDLRFALEKRLRSWE